MPIRRHPSRRRALGASARTVQATPVLATTTAPDLEGRRRGSAAFALREPTPRLVLRLLPVSLFRFLPTFRCLPCFPEPGLAASDRAAPRRACAPFASARMATGGPRGIATTRGDRSRRPTLRPRRIARSTRVRSMRATRRTSVRSKSARRSTPCVLHPAPSCRAGSADSSPACRVFSPSSPACRTMRPPTAPRLGPFRPAREPRPPCP